MACPHCIKPYTEVARKPCTCPRCNYTVCTDCMKYYIHEKLKYAHCMECKYVFEKDYICTIFSKSWVNKDYKRHCDEVLAHERELALMPAHQRALYDDM